MTQAQIDSPRSPDCHAAEARPPLPPGPYLVLGLGRAGQAAVKALVARFGADSIRTFDEAPAERLRHVRAALTADGVASSRTAAGLLDGIGAIVKSPGVDLANPLLEEARQRGIVILDELELGWRLSTAPVIAVTGTNGKSTTSALIVAALEAGDASPLLCGNSHHGPPMSAVALEHEGWLVAEVSSFQAEGCPAFLPAAAVFTNLTRDHLHRHGSMATDAAAKRRLFVRGDRAVPLAVLIIDDAFGRRLAREVAERGGRAVTYGTDRRAEYRIDDCGWSLRDGVVMLDTPGGALRLTTPLPGRQRRQRVAALALAMRFTCRERRRRSAGERERQIEDQRRRPDDFATTRRRPARHVVARRAGCSGRQLVQAPAAPGSNSASSTRQACSTPSTQPGARSGSTRRHGLLGHQLDERVVSCGETLLCCTGGSLG